MPFLTIAWAAPYSMGIMPADSSVVLDTPLTVPWNQKQSTYVLPYDPDDLTVKAAPAPPITNPVDVPAPGLPGTVGGPPTTPPAPAPAPIRPAPVPKIVALGRITPAAYRSKGIRVKITLTQKARVVVHLEARMRKKTVKRRTVTSVRRLTKQRAVTLKAGTTTLRLTPTAAGRRAIGRNSRTKASLLVSARYADGRRTTSRRTVIIAPAKASSKKD